jgi:endonuclease YncB( thermonuclease family)
MSCLTTGLCFVLTALPSQVTAVDGDTLRVQLTAEHRAYVRLFGIDTEERNEPNGPAAKAHLQSLVNRGDSVVCHPIGKMSYQRQISRCYILVGEMKYELNSLMVKDGFALDCARYSKGMYRVLEPDDSRQKLLAKPYCDR